MIRQFNILSLFLLSLSSFCQTLQGTVVDVASGMAIDGASVSLVSARGLAKTFALTDAKGHFVLSTAAMASGDSLRVACLGYKAVKMAPSQWPSDGRIALHDEAFQLREVSVKSHRIAAAGDTLTYAVAGFTMPGDRSIADVIAKMPGMEVDPSGQIRYQGTAINKFYIEGMDLMGSRYSLASNNMSHKAVKSVQVLRNHQPVAMLRGRSFSDQAAINLVLEDHAKLTLTGTADTALGASRDRALYQSRLLAMLFGHRQQNLSLYKTNNTGHELLSEVLPQVMGSEDNNMETTILSAPGIASPDVALERYNLNHSHLAAVNHLFQMGEKATLRLQASYLSDVDDRASWQQTGYIFSPDSLPTVVESHSAHNHRDRMEASVRTEINRDNLFLDNSLHAVTDRQSARSLTVLNDDSRLLTSRLRRHMVGDVLQLRLPIGKERQLSLHTANDYQHHPQLISLYDGRSETVGYTKASSKTHAAMRLRLLGLYADYRAGLDVSRQTLQADVDGGLQMGLQRLVTVQPYLSAIYGWRRSNVDTEAAVRLGRQTWRMNSGGNATKGNSFSPMVSAKVRYDISGVSRLTMSYRYDRDMDNLRQLFAGDLYTSYRTMANFDHTPRMEASHRLAAGYEYSHPVDGLFASLRASWGLTGRHAATRFTVSPDGRVVQMRMEDADYDHRSLVLSSRVSQAMSWWKGMVALSGFYSLTSSSQYVDTQLTGYHLDTFLATLSYNARPLRQLAFDLSSSATLTRFHLLQTTHTRQLSHALQLTMPLFKDFTLKVDNTVRQWLDLHETTWFADCEARYAMGRVELSLKATNLAGRDRYDRETVTSLSHSFMHYTLRPREVMVGVEVSL